MHSNATPPVFPRPSSSIAKGRLRGRLQCSSHVAQEKVFAKKDIGGIGESQFDRFDDDEDFNSDHQMSILNQSIEKSSMTISPRIRLVDHSVRAANDSIRPHSTSTQHTTYANSITNNRKWDRIASSLASGKTEFCYMEELADNTYKFTFTKTPTTKHYATLSRNGILRMHDGLAEKIDFSTFMSEHLLYTKLRCLRMFGMFRLWKSFFVWNKTILRRKFLRNVS